MGGGARARGPWPAVILCLLGIGVVGAGLAYALHVSSDLGSRRIQPAAQSAGVSVSDQRSVAITPGREVIGAVLSLDEKAITVRSAPDGGTVVLRTDTDTQVTTTHGNTLSDLAVGDVVIIQVSTDGKSALAIYAGQISVAGTPSVG
ncbi:hypothetical protein TPB0596_05240 [Tsukamurella pulmonis]|uniref:DUF5666 domain-containing protein n=1 Tax=Tsukamurella pulmonis TaxID=47312 RepID=A0A1H1HK15_9ACTN|nr:hypothetical protein [Tsukamurella pulmonis]BDD80761.1 hypothetical protein TPB0596_05240 [Tsukamurella pulmonis]SDR25860.1 hypothetical protein SAMN04489765_4300 [Tsukamurella pulmonis]SUP14240.1 Uncharacterised protein [Tsukamurella pulmonis]